MLGTHQIVEDVHHVIIPWLGLVLLWGVQILVDVAQLERFDLMKIPNLSFLLYSLVVERLMFWTLSFFSLIFNLILLLLFSLVERMFWLLRDDIVVWKTSLPNGSCPPIKLFTVLPILLTIVFLLLLYIFWRVLIFAFFFLESLHELKVVCSMLFGENVAF